MVAKVSKSKTKMKNQPHIRTMTKTLVKKHKNKGGMGVKAVKTLKKKMKSEKKGLEKKVRNVKKLLKNKKAKKDHLIGPNGKVIGFQNKEKEKVDKQSYEEAAPWSLLLDTNGNVDSVDGGEDEYIGDVEEDNVTLKDEKNVDDSAEMSTDAEISDADESIQEGAEVTNGPDEKRPKSIREIVATSNKKKINSKKVKKLPVKSHSKETAVNKKANKGIKKVKKATVETKKKNKRSKKTKKTSRRFESDYEMMKEKERELAMDLFGTDAGIGHAKREPSAISTLTENAVKNEAEKKRKKSESEDDVGVEEIFDTEPKRKAAWVDEDDDNIRVKDVVANMVKARGTRGERETSTKKYESELREKFNQVYGGTPDWADLDRTPDEDDDDELVRRTGNYLSKESSTSLPKRVLEYKAMVDLNSSHTEGSRIEAIDFNPNLQVALVAGCIKNTSAVTLYQVDGKVNHRLHSARFPGYGLTCAHFLRDGRKFVLGSNVDCHFYVYDMETSAETRLLWKKKTDRIAKEHVYVSPDGKLLVLLGHSGKICIYDTATLSLVDVLQAPHVVISATFNADGSRMYTHGNTGEVCVWDMNARECVHKFHDDGCISGGIVSMSPNNQYLACGSNSGVVNIYDSAGLSSSTPKPVKALYNLKTKVTSLRFNSSSELLAMASDRLNNALKLVHFPSMTVFENFPIVAKAVKPVECLQFSPQSGYFAVGNRSGAAQLFRMKHFVSY